MSNIILPGTYITVRDEGLISVGGVSTGNIGIVGTATDGSPNRVQVLNSFTDARDIFGSQDENKGTNAQPATLLKALELLFANGASTVYAVRAADESVKSYAAGLELLANETVNLVLLAGQDATNDGMVEILNAHLASTETEQKERIGLIGCNGSVDPSKIIADKERLVNDRGRMVYVAPGIKFSKRDPATGTKTTEVLSGAYTAAAVAGLIASLPIQASPTNKTVNLSGLATKFNHGQLTNLVKANVLTIEQREGLRVVKGITTSNNNAWSQITTRRIVDYATYGVRLACNPYVGKLNNQRVRSAMKATLDGFLTRMVESEALIGYQLEVTATRAQEVAGQAMVNMVIRPTFSIDYIMVTMSLG